MQYKTFGRLPKGAQLERIKQSPNYKNGAFQNVIPTEVMLKDAPRLKLFSSMLRKPAYTVPALPIPTMRTNLRQLNDAQPVIVWFGHSSYLIRHQGFTILVDPVFSGQASPVSFTGKAFPGADAYTAADFDQVDLLVITHDHYDHLDYLTILQLIPKTRQVCTSLGVGAHLEYWGMPAGKITELDWWQTMTIQQNLQEKAQPHIHQNIQLTATPARHFSGRVLKRGQSLWSSFVLSLNGYNLFLGGDSGYSPSFAQIGKKYGPFDIALLESGQYGQYWPQIHMTPEQTIQVATELNTRLLLPVHWAKFDLALHPWNEPIQRVTAEAARRSMPITTPMIGEPVTLGSPHPAKRWWEA